MPLYEYQCETCSNRFERILKFSDPPIAICPACGGPVRKLISSPAFQFKGTGWYITDYAKKSGTDGGKASEGGKTSDSGKSSSDQGSASTGDSSSSAGSSGSSSTSNSNTSTSANSSTGKSSTSGGSSEKS
jgi:putative FmdB family regulatory protein